MNSCVTVFGLYIGPRKKDKQKIKRKLTREKKKKILQKKITPFITNLATHFLMLQFFYSGIYKYLDYY